MKIGLNLHSLTTDLWCNGSTADSGSACPGSNPGKSTKMNAIHLFFQTHLNPPIMQTCKGLRDKFSVISEMLN